MLICSLLPGEPCPTCGTPVERVPRMFYWRGTFYDGAVCPRTNGLGPIKGEEMPPLRLSPPPDA